MPNFANATVVQRNEALSGNEVMPSGRKMGNAGFPLSTPSVSRKLYQSKQPGEQGDRIRSAPAFRSRVVIEFR